METLLALCIGLGLSAACGFRVFVPLLGLSIAAHAGHVALAADFAWLGSIPAIIALSFATALEIGGYYIPWLDHFLDALATPAAVVAGAMVSASLITDMSPMMRWSLAVIAGGGLAGLVQTTTVLARAGSTLTTGGLGNPLVATLELGGSLLSTLLSLLAPALGVGVVLACAGLIGVHVHRRRQTAAAPQQGGKTSSAGAAT
ncbi:MAG: DUF4126 domain-containing protein [Verrucomicrobia bacterium]|nr:DUF4126 domain-containing protein [Verrucomicrobiota bacterium]MBI3868222.1 DUF4126 domain-containing protein [Verrucomicrobiota bacterium]